MNVAATRLMAKQLTMNSGYKCWYEAYLIFFFTLTNSSARKIVACVCLSARTFESRVHRQLPGHVAGIKKHPTSMGNSSHS